jgi:ABC-type Fe3+ transport system permease subunit
MADPFTLALLDGLLSVALGALFACGVWRFGIRGKASNKWLYALRFSLWSALLPAFFVGDGVSQFILGIPDSAFSMSLQDSLVGTLGFYVIGFTFLFRIGVVRARKKLAREPQAKHPTV